MLNPRLAARYAKSLMDIALEQNKLDVVYQDMLGLKSVFDESRDFVMMMKSPVIKADTKYKVIQSVAEGKIDSITQGFIKLIVNKGREYFLQEIAASFISLYKVHNKINEVSLTTATTLDEEMTVLLQRKLAQQFEGMSIDLTTRVDENLLGGFVLEANNNVFDASIKRDLDDIRKQFLKNEYVPDIR